jgi:hypothetical protein
MTDALKGGRSSFAVTSSARTIPGIKSNEKVMNVIKLTANFKFLKSHREFSFGLLKD